MKFFFMLEKKNFELKDRKYGIVFAKGYLETTFVADERIINFKRSCIQYVLNCN